MFQLTYLLVWCVCGMQLIKPAEMCNPKVDELSVMTYLSQFPNCHLKPGAPLRPKTNPARVRAYGPGTVSTNPTNAVLSVWGEVFPQSSVVYTEWLTKCCEKLLPPIMMWSQNASECTTEQKKFIFFIEGVSRVLPDLEANPLERRSKSPFVVPLIHPSLPVSRVVYATLNK